MTRNSLRLAALIHFLLTLIVYVQVVPWVMKTWKITGDEPHYLLAAHSLAYDGDLDLKNNYLDGDHRGFYSGGFLDAHIRQQPDGAWLLTHDIGLSILIAPAYRLGGRRGVVQFFAVVGAWLAAQMFLLGAETTGKWWAGALSSAALSFSAPLCLYVFQIYPEMIGGALTLWAMRTATDSASWGQPHADNNSGSEYMLPLVLAALPWLSGRYVPIALAVAAVAVLWHRRRKAMIIATAVPVLISIAAYLASNFYFFDSLTPATTSAGSAVTAGFGNVAAPQIGRGLAGWLFDQQRGLLLYGPILMVAIFGLPQLWSARGSRGLATLVPFVIAWVLAAVWGGFFIGWEISARFLMVGVPLLTAPLAAAAGGIRRIVFFPMAAGLLTLSVINAVLIILSPFFAFHESPVKFYEEATRWQIRPYLPALGTRFIVVPVGGAAQWVASGAGGPRYLHQGEIEELSIGWYGAFAQAHFANAPDDEAIALNFDVYSSESGIPLMHYAVRPADADPATGIANLRMHFYNPYFDKWNFPLYFDISTTGAADVQLSWVLFEPDPAQTYLRVAAWLGLILVVTFYLNRPPAKLEITNPVP